MTPEEIDTRLSMIPSYALYAAITTGLNCQIASTRVTKHPFREFHEWQDKDVEHYNYVKYCVPSDIKRIEQNIQRIKNTSKRKLYGFFTFGITIRSKLL